MDEWAWEQLEGEAAFGSSSQSDRDRRGATRALGLSRQGPAFTYLPVQRSRMRSWGMADGSREARRSWPPLERDAQLRRGDALSAPHVYWARSGQMPQQAINARRALGLIPATTVMIYAARDDAELAVVETLVRASHAFARPA